MQRLLPFLLVVFALGALASGCDSDDDGPATPGDPAVFVPGTASGKSIDSDIDVTVRAAYDATRIALRFSWETNKNYAGIFHDLRRYDTATNAWVNPATDIDNVMSKVEEDRVALIIDGAPGKVAGFSYLGCFATCHSDMNDMPQATVDARHYVIPSEGSDLNTFQLDMWHWRGGRSGPMGYAEDTWVRSHEFASGAQGRRRDTAGPDGNLRGNQGFAVSHTVSVNGQATEINLPEFVYDPTKNNGFYFLNDGSKLITEEKIGNLFSANTIAKMEAGTLPHGLVSGGPLANAISVTAATSEVKDAIALQALAGGVINRPRMTDSMSDQHDIRSDRAFDGPTGVWTVTLYRNLDTGSNNDVSLAGLPTGAVYTLGMSIHDSNDGGRSHQVSVPVTLGTAGADINAASVSNVESVNWATVASFTTTTFKPGDMSLEFLESSHPVDVTADCATCHIGAENHPGSQPTGNCIGCHTDGNRALHLWDYAPVVAP